MHAGPHIQSAHAQRLTQICLLNSDTMLVASVIEFAIVLTISKIIVADVTMMYGRKSGFIIIANKLFAVGAQLVANCMSCFLQDFPALLPDVLLSCKFY